MMVMYNYTELFPTVVISTDIGRDLTHEEKQCVKKIEEQGKMPNVGNKMSVSHNVLEFPEMKELKKHILDAAKQYLAVVIAPTNELDLRIVLSWLNWTKDDEFHHMHKHPNSYLSGVFYLSAEEKDTIRFLNINYDNYMFRVESSNHNKANAPTWCLPVETGKLIIFPSWLYHSVDTRQPSENDRISLSFNIIPVGMVGDGVGLTSLEIL